MSSPELAPPGVADATLHETAPAASARDDLVGGLAWMALGVVIAVASWRMDRLEQQGIDPYTAPGLVPGLLGLAMIFFGGLMALRAARAGASFARGPRSVGPRHYGRLATVLVLCIGFAVGLVGHGLPFWVAAAIFVAVAIMALQYRELRNSGRLGRGLASAAVIGVAAGAIVTLVFEKLFLVRLP